MQNKTVLRSPEVVVMIDYSLRRNERGQETAIPTIFELQPAALSMPSQFANYSPRRYVKDTRRAKERMGITLPYFERTSVGKHSQRFALSEGGCEDLQPKYKIINAAAVNKEEILAFLKDSTARHFVLKNSATTMGKGNVFIRKDELEKQINDGSFLFGSAGFFVLEEQNAYPEIIGGVTNYKTYRACVRFNPRNPRDINVTPICCYIHENISSHSCDKAGGIVDFVDGLHYTFKDLKVVDVSRIEGIPEIHEDTKQCFLRAVRALSQHLDAYPAGPGEGSEVLIDDCAQEHAAYPNPTNATGYLIPYYGSSYNLSKSLLNNLENLLPDSKDSQEEIRKRILDLTSSYKSSSDIISGLVNIFSDILSIIGIRGISSLSRISNSLSWEESNQNYHLAKMLAFVRNGYVRREPDDSNLEEYEAHKFLINRSIIMGVDVDTLMKLRTNLSKREAMGEEEFKAISDGDIMIDDITIEDSLAFDRDGSLKEDFFMRITGSLQNKDTLSSTLESLNPRIIKALTKKMENDLRNEAFEIVVNSTRSLDFEDHSNDDLLTRRSTLKNLIHLLYKQCPRCYLENRLEDAIANIPRSIITIAGNNRPIQEMSASSEIKNLLKALNYNIGFLTDLQKIELVSKLHSFAEAGRDSIDQLGIKYPGIADSSAAGPGMAASGDNSPAASLAKIPSMSLLPLRTAPVAPLPRGCCC